MAKVAHDTSRPWPGEAIASWHRSRDRRGRKMNEQRVLPAFRVSTCQIVCPEWSGGPTAFCELSAQLLASRFVTIIGPGGVGKTTVAIAVAHDLLEAFAEAVMFVDLGALSEPDLVTTSLSLMLGLPVQSDDPTPSLIAYLRDKRMLLILDNCEHVIEAVAALATTHFPGRAAGPSSCDEPRGSES